MGSPHIPKEGQLLVGPLFNEPMLVETVRSGGVAAWTVGLVGSRTHQFRRMVREALLSGMTRGGWTITGSWLVATEMGARLNARDTASLATSIHLVCRPRTEDITGDWGEVLLELPKRVGDWIARLKSEGVRGADSVFACIGPALEIFSRHVRVETPDGTEKTLAEYLEKVWDVVGRVAPEKVLGSPEAQPRNGGTGALEEDARLTALFLWTVQATDDQAEDSVEGDEEESADDEDEEAAPGKKKPGFTLI